MKLVIANKNIVGNKLANPLYNERGIMFLNSGNVITENVLRQLKKMCITSVYIEDGNDEMELQEVIPTAVKVRNIKLIKQVFNDAKKNDFIDDRAVLGIIEDVMRNLNVYENAVLLNNIMSDDELTSRAIHSLDVLVLALIVGVNKKFSEEKLTRLGTAALLHDIGKMFTEGEDHVKKGQSIIKSNNSFAATVYMSVYYLQECVDGSGLMGVSGDKIPEFSKIIAICNRYSKLTAGEDAILPHQAMEVLSAKVATKLDKDMLKEFIDSVYCYPTGLRVKLSNGEEGIVAMQNKGMTTRPVVIINDNGEYKFFNLIDKDNLTLSIQEVIM